MEVSPIRIPATKRSGTITTGGTAQDLMVANANRKGWAIQNQSSGDLYVCSKGELGTVATADQNCIKIATGVYYEPPRVTAHALSIIGATTAQAFWAEEW